MKSLVLVEKMADKWMHNYLNSDKICAHKSTTKKTHSFYSHSAQKHLGCIWKKPLLGVRSPKDTLHPFLLLQAIIEQLQMIVDFEKLR